MIRHTFWTFCNLTPPDSLELNHIVCWDRPLWFRGWTNETCRRLPHGRDPLSHQHRILWIFFILNFPSPIPLENRGSCCWLSSSCRIGFESTWWRTLCSIWTSSYRDCFFPSASNICYGIYGRRWKIKNWMQKYIRRSGLVKI